MMKAMILSEIGKPLMMAWRDKPAPKGTEVLVRVSCCGVCRTDLHILDGELPTPPVLPLVLGHEIVGRVEAVGENAGMLAPGARVGIPWLGATCGTCFYCKAGMENLCDAPAFTGYHRDGGYGEYTLADARYALPLPVEYSDEEAAPLLCAGLIGHRALGMTADGKKIGLYGFGAAAHIIAQVARFQGREVYAFTRPGKKEDQEFALELGAVWAGGSDTLAPTLLDGAIIFAPAGELVVQALRAVRKGGVVVCAGIHMSAIPSFPYELLWGERKIVSVANLTRANGIEFFAIAPKVPVRTAVEVFPLAEANTALERLRQGKIRGAAVLKVHEG